LQKTFGPLIWLLLCYKFRKDPTHADVLTYQRDSWGRFGGETALLELSAPPSRDTNNRAIPRHLYRAERIVKLRTMLQQKQPEFVVFYSSAQEYLEAWRQITGVKLDCYQPVRVGTTICLVTDHPTRRWGDYGKLLRDMDTWGGCSLLLNQARQKSVTASV
jgi:hypothetical protein